MRLTIVTLIGLLALTSPAAAQLQPSPPAASTIATERTAHVFSFPGLMGGQVRLADHRGKVILVVNTASECGYTPQLGGLQKVYEARGREGLVVIGVPSNDFGGQEPGQAKDIAKFCKLNYGVTFPMAAKQAVKGDQAHPFYRWARTTLGPAGEPRWNFHKVLVGRDGRAIAAFGSKVAPDAPDLRAAIDAALESD